MKPYKKYDIFDKEHLLFNSDFMEVAKTLPPKSQHLIICDPPYFEVKGDFDFIWSSFEDYLKDVEKWAIELKRILADNGTLFWWGMDRKIAYAQVVLDKYFNLEGALVWEKPSNPNEWDTRRTFPERGAERVLMYSNEIDCTGLEMIMDEHIKPKHPFAIYIREEFKKAGVKNREVAVLFPSKTGGLTGCVSNWLNGDNTPTKEQYLKMRDFLNGEYLKKEYEELRQEYEDKRRYFYNYANQTDILRFSRDNTKYNHDTKKPVSLTKMLVKTCSKKGQNMFIPFGGSGTETEVGINEGLKVIVCEMEEKHCKTIDKRIETETLQQTLF